MAQVLLWLLQNLLVSPDRSDLELDHYGMEKLKKRLLEFLAVRQLKNEMKGKRCICNSSARSNARILLDTSIRKNFKGE